MGPTWAEPIFGAYGPFKYGPSALRCGAYGPLKLASGQ